MLKKALLAAKFLRFNLVDPDLPLKYFLVVTKSCGSKCSNCRIWTQKNLDELTLSEYEEIAKKSSDNLVWLNISGGEPSDREDLLEIIQTFVRHCPSLQIVNFTTNGNNLENLKRVASYLNELNLSYAGINVSIDGPPEIHKKIRGIDGYQQSIEALKELRKFKKLHALAGMTIFPGNIDFIEETILSIQKHIPGFTVKDMHFNLPHSSEHYYGNNTEFLDHIDLEKLKPFSKANTFPSSPLDIVEIIYQKKINEFKSTRKNPFSCAAVRSNIYISEKGDIYPCTIWNKKLGSLRENDYDLKRILKHSSIPEIQKTIREKNCPNCWTPCEAFPSILTDLKSML